MSETALDTITVKGFKSIASVDALPLRPINVIIGANGSGKSNFIGVFSFLHAIREGRLQEYVRSAGGADQLLHFGSRTTDGIHIVLSFSRGVNEYCLSLAPTEDDSLYPRRETSLYPRGEMASYWNRAEYATPRDVPLAPRGNGREAGISDPGLSRIEGWVRERLGRWHVYHMHDTSVASPMRVNDGTRLTRLDRERLAGWLEDYSLGQLWEKNEFGGRPGSE